MKKKWTPTPPTEPQQSIRSGVEMKTAEQINGPQVGNIEVKVDGRSISAAEAILHLGEMQKKTRPEVVFAPDGLQGYDMTPDQVRHGYVQLIRGALRSVREIRDRKEYLTDGSGSHTFREWCMRQFGEKLGGWLEENL